MHIEKLINKTVGRNLKILRKKKNLSQNALASLLKVSYQQVQKYESGKNRLPISYLFILKTHLDVPFEAFFEHEALQTRIIYSREEVLEMIYEIKNQASLDKVGRILRILMLK